MTRKFRVGEKVKFGLGFDLDGRDYIAYGETGTVVSVSNARVGVRLDREHPALACFGNTFAIDREEAKHLRKRPNVLRRTAISSGMLGLWLLLGPFQIDLGYAAMCVATQVANLATLWLQ
jgi:hypothetical protein